jgi:hypothetical protein
MASTSLPRGSAASRQCTARHPTSAAMDASSSTTARLDATRRTTSRDPRASRDLHSRLRHAASKFRRRRWPREGSKPLGQCVHVRGGGGVAGGQGGRGLQAKRAPQPHVTAGARDGEQQWGWGGTTEGAPRPTWSMESVSGVPHGPTAPRRHTGCTPGPLHARTHTPTHTHGTTRGKAQGVNARR